MESSATIAFTTTCASQRLHFATQDLKLLPMRSTRKLYTEATLYDYAIGALARRMRTVAELKRLLRAKAGPAESSKGMIESVIRRLKDQKYLNDTHYAAAYSRNRKENERFGKRRIIRDLKAKGVHGDIIQSVVASTYEGVNEDQLARQFLERKRIRKPANERETARIFRMMMRAGFGAGAIFKVLKRWKIEDDLLATLEEEQDLDQQ
jgi:regulatory protein